MDGWMYGRMDCCIGERSDAWMDGLTERWIDEWIYGQTGGWMDGWVDRWMDRWMVGWMYGLSDGRTVELRDGWTDG
jgi:hypothetical protein